MDKMKAVALVCTLKPSPDESSRDVIARHVLDELAKHDVTGRLIRVVDHDVQPGGVAAHERDGRLAGDSL